MKRGLWFTTALLAIVAASDVSAQCYQNGLSCGQLATDASGLPLVVISQTPSLPSGTNTVGSIGNTSFGASQQGSWTIDSITKPVSVTGTFWQATQPTSQSGSWNVGLTGTLPAFTSTPTFNLGTLNGAATDASVQAIKTALGSPFQTGASIANTSFGASQIGSWNIGTISSITNPVAVTGQFYQANQPVSQLGTWSTTLTGTLPAFAATPTFNMGSLNGGATDSSVRNITTALGTPFQTGGSIANTAFGATQQGEWSVGLASGTNTIGSIANTSFNSVQQGPWSVGITGTVPVTGSFYQATQPVSQSGTWNFTLGSGTNTIGSIANTSFGAAQLGSWHVLLDPGTNAIGSITNTGFSSSQQGTWHIGLDSGANVIGSIANQGFAVTGLLPAFAVTPTVNLGTLGDAATATNQVTTLSVLGTPTDAAATTTNSTASSLMAQSKQSNVLAGQIKTVLGSPFQAGGVIGNTSFGVSSLPSLPTGSNAIGSITNTTFGASQSGAWNIGSVGTITNPVGLATGTNTIGAVNVNGTIPVSGTFYQATQPISANTLPLPSGAATAALQTSMMTTFGSPTDIAATTTDATSTSLVAQAKQQVVKLNTVISTLGSPLQAGGSISNVTGTVSLPTGASTAALQTSMGNQLASIITNTTGASTAALQTTMNNNLATLVTNTTGAATAAKQPALGIAGTPSTDVLSIQGVNNGIGLSTSEVPTASANNAISPTTTAGVSSSVLKAAPGNLYSLNVENSTNVGFILAYDATSAPASGATLVPSSIRYHYAITANAPLDKSFNMPAAFSSGITILCSSSITLFTPITCNLITGQVK